MTENQFRRVALAMKAAVEGRHMAHPDFRVNGRIFASIYPDRERGMVQLSPEQQRAFMGDYPAVFEPASGAWGRGGSTTVRLDAADEEIVGEAMTLAWRNAVDKAAAKKTVKKKPAAARRKKR